MALRDKLDAWCSSFVIQVPRYECPQCGHRHQTVDAPTPCPECEGELTQVGVDVYPNDWH